MWVSPDEQKAGKNSGWVSLGKQRWVKSRERQREKSKDDRKRACLVLVRSYGEHLCALGNHDPRNVVGVYYSLYFQANLQYILSGIPDWLPRENRSCPTSPPYIALESHRNLNIINVLRIISRDLNRFTTTVLPNSMDFFVLTSKWSFTVTSIVASSITASPESDAKTAGMSIF
jgi:hypothetical protein